MVLASSFEELRLPDGRKAMVRNGYLPERSIQTGRCSYTRFDHNSQYIQHLIKEAHIEGFDYESYLDENVFLG